MKVHLRDIRLRNNAGLDFPLCCTGGELLDIDKGRLPTTETIAEVTCKHCLRLAPKRYPWVYNRA